LSLARTAAGTVRIAVFSFIEGFPDFFALRADGKTLRITAGNPHLAAQRDDGVAHHHGFSQGVFGNKVAESLVIAVVKLLLGALIEHRIGRGSTTKHSHLAILSPPTDKTQP
jgi:hypothetical protein